jgi:hypothetical protein
MEIEGASSTAPLHSIQQPVHVTINALPSATTVEALVVEPSLAASPGQLSDNASMHDKVISLGLSAIVASVLAADLPSQVVSIDSQSGLIVH